jgi:SAM-dependent methyltransferase
MKQEDKSDAYYNVGEDFEKYLAHSMQPEVEEMFLRHSGGAIQRLLDVGCASGRTSVFTLRHGVTELVGVELDPRGAQIARRHMTHVVQGDASSMELPYPESYFDALFFTDILEHLIDPWQALRRALHWLKPGGSVLVVLPNMGHLAVIQGLLAGQFKYEESGLLDSGHLRFFVQNSAVELLQRAGLEVVDLQYRLDPDWQLYQHNTKIPLIGGVFTLELDPKRVPESLRKTWFARKLHFWARKPG